MFRTMKITQRLALLLVVLVVVAGCTAPTKPGNPPPQSLMPSSDPNAWDGGFAVTFQQFPSEATVVALANARGVASQENPLVYFIPDDGMDIRGDGPINNALQACGNEPGSLVATISKKKVRAE